MKDLKLKVENVLPELSLDGVDKIGFDLGSVKKGKFSYKSKDFGVRFNADLLNKSGKVLDSGFVYLNFSKDLFSSLVEEGGSYSFDVVLKGFEEEYSKTESVKLKVSETEKEILDVLLDASNKAEDGLESVKAQIQELLEKTDVGGQKFLDSLKAIVSDYSCKACDLAKDGKEKAKDFAQRAKSNDLSKKEMLVVGGIASVILTALLAGRKK
ncbi:hypothetical protein ACTOJ1_000338 [Shigella flexneri]